MMPMAREISELNHFSISIEKTELIERGLENLAFPMVGFRIKDVYCSPLIFIFSGKSTTRKSDKEFAKILNRWSFNVWTFVKDSNRRLSF